MNQPAALGRERFVWCKGIGLALLDFADQNQRPFLGLCFSSEAELEVFVRPPGPFDPRLALEMAAPATSTAVPTSKGPSAMPSNTRGFGPAGAKGRKAAGADVVFIVDGEASLSSAFVREFLREKAAARLRLFTVLIDGFHEGLATLSDAVFTVRGWTASIRGKAPCGRWDAGSSASRQNSGRLDPGEGDAMRKVTLKSASIRLFRSW